MSDLTNVFREWFQVVAMPIDMAANAVKTIGKEHLQPIADKSKKSLEENMDIINTKYPKLLHQVGEDMTDFKHKIKQAADTTVNYSQAIDVPAFPLLTADDIPGYQYIPTADDIPGVRAIKQLTGFESEESENTQRGGTRRRHRHRHCPRRCRRRHQRCQHRRRKRTKKRALKKRHRHKKTRARRR